MAETPQEFPCFACGDEGPHVVIPLERSPGMTDEEWAGHAGPPLIKCRDCHETIWEPDAGDGFDTPNLTMIPPGLRDLAREALEARNLPRFLILAEGHHRDLLAEDNVVYFRQRELWDDVLLAKLRLEQTD